MQQKAYLMVPGPTPVPERVQAAMNRPMINHRGPGYEAMFRDISARLKTLFHTNHDVLTYPSSGTGVMEAAIVNFFSPGDKILLVSIGVFGDRLGEIATTYGLNVEKIAVKWGEMACPEQLAARLAEDKAGEIKGVLLTHNETSTGVTNDVCALAKAKGKHPALLIVDAVSALGAIPMRMDEWGIDVVVTGSQKALMIPPGLGFMALNDRAWAAYEKSALPKYYLDAKKVKKSLDKGQNPYTPPVSLLYGLQESLKMIAEEGEDAIVARHILLGEAVRAGVKAMGLRLFAADGAASSVVTAVWAPEGVSGKDVQKKMRDVFGVTIAGGQKELEGKIFRIGHLGYAAAADVLVTLAMLEMTLTELGVKVSLGAGVAAAQAVFLAAHKEERQA